MAEVLRWPVTGPDDPLHRPVHRRALHRVRTMCLALPEATEKIIRGHMPTFRVRGKQFAIVARGEGRPSLWCKAPLGGQQLLAQADPEHYFVPPYVGVRGWVGVWLDVDVDWGAVETLVEDGYRMTAPKRLIQLLADSAAS